MWFYTQIELPQTRQNAIKAYGHVEKVMAVSMFKKSNGFHEKISDKKP